MSIRDEYYAIVSKTLPTRDEAWINCITDKIGHIALCLKFTSNDPFVGVLIVLLDNLEEQKSNTLSIEQIIYGIKSLIEKIENINSEIPKTVKFACENVYADTKEIGLLEINKAYSKMVANASDEIYSAVAKKINRKVTLGTFGYIFGCLAMVGLFVGSIKFYRVSEAQEEVISNRAYARGRQHGENDLRREKEQVFLNNLNARLKSEREAREQKLTDRENQLNEKSMDVQRRDQKLNADRTEFENKKLWHWTHLMLVAFLGIAGILLAWFRPPVFGRKIF